MGVVRSQLPAIAGVLWFSAGGGRRRPTGSVAGAFTKRKCIPRNTLRARAGQPARRREAAAQEGVGWRGEEEGGRWGWVGQKGPGGLIKGRTKKGFHFQI
jgi:hypothetical protein